MDAAPSAGRARFDLDRLLDARPAWARRAAARLKARISADARWRRRALALGLVAWQVNDAILPRRLVMPVRNLLIAMVVFDSAATWVWVSTGVAAEGNPIVAAVMALLGDGLGLVVRTVWTVVLVWMLAWLADRRAAIRPLMALVTLVLGLVTLLHAAILGWALSLLLTLV